MVEGLLCSPLCDIEAATRPIIGVGYRVHCLNFDPEYRVHCLNFDPDLSPAEIRPMSCGRRWVRSCEEIVWRESKVGVHHRAFFSHSGLRSLGGHSGRNIGW